MTGPATDVRIEKVVTSGTFSLDGGTWDVDNNVWLIGNDDEVVIIDAAHDAAAIVAAVAGRTVIALICTHGHNDHINAAGDVRDRVKAPVYLHPGDRMLWDELYPEVAPDRELTHRFTLEVGGVELSTFHTPGHSPGSTSLYVATLGAVFTGDTLFHCGPGATGRSYSDFDTIIRSISDRLLVLPPDTVVHTGHGENTTIGAEAPQLQEWIARGS